MAVNHNKVNGILHIALFHLYAQTNFSRYQWIIMILRHQFKMANGNKNKKRSFNEKVIKLLPFPFNPEAWRFFHVCLRFKLNGFVWLRVTLGNETLSVMSRNWQRFWRHSNMQNETKRNETKPYFPKRYFAK